MSTKCISFLMNSFLYLSDAVERHYSTYQDNQKFLNEKLDVKVLTFYLPQFHETQENNEWWGQGFTEWVNTRKALPRFENHYQPRIPHEDIGYYDLSEIESIKKQVLLAKQHGIYGFVFYYYWFSGKRLLEKPVDLLLEHPEIDLNFCLCWANGHWTRTWDGLNKNILMKQLYTDEDPVNFIKDIKKYTDDSRYIRVQGKPVIMVYDAAQIPNVNQVFSTWKNCAKELGVGEILIWLCRTPGSGIEELGLQTVVDKEIEFPPRNMVSFDILEPGLVSDGDIYNYSKLVDKLLFLRKNEQVETNLYRCAMLGWDNSARRKDGYTVYDKFDLKKYYDWLSANIKETKALYPVEERFTFINAWNEWAEGTYLEPDQKYGYASINVTSQAIYGIAFDAPIVINNDVSVKRRIAIQIDINYLETLEELILFSNNIPYRFDCYISTDTMEKALYIEKSFKESSKANRIIIQIVSNKNREIVPCIIQMQDVLENYDFFCHIHSEKHEFNSDLRKYLLRSLLYDESRIRDIIETFEEQENIGIAYPELFSNFSSYIVWGEYKKDVVELLDKINGFTRIDDIPEFPAGNMFWAKTDAVKQIFNHYSFNGCLEENRENELVLNHIIERAWYYVAKANGYEKKTI